MVVPFMETIASYFVTIPTYKAKKASRAGSGRTFLDEARFGGAAHLAYETFLRIEPRTTRTIPVYPRIEKRRKEGVPGSVKKVRGYIVLCMSFIMYQRKSTDSSA